MEAGDVLWNVRGYIFRAGRGGHSVSHGNSIHIKNEVVCSYLKLMSFKLVKALRPFPICRRFLVDQRACSERA